MNVLVVLLMILGSPWMAPIWAMIALYAFARWRERSAFQRGSKRYQQGRLSEAISLLATAENQWSLNSIHGTPGQFASDYRRLRNIVSLLVRAVNENGGDVDAHELLQILEDQARLWSDKSNLIWGTHALKRESNEINLRNMQRLAELRQNLRSAVQGALLSAA